MHNLNYNRHNYNLNDYFETQCIILIIIVSITIRIMHFSKRAYYALVNKAYGSSQGFCYNYFNALEENKIIIQYKIDFFAGVIPRLDACFKRNDLIFSEFRCNWSNSRLKDISH